VTNKATIDNYADPLLYDLESGPFVLENTFLLNAFYRAGGPVLELGCGTGRVTIPAASRGVDITGIDDVPHMLDHARRKAGYLPVNWAVIILSVKLAKLNHGGLPDPTYKSKI
jgi:2-polyprenyl-3-methyl-5-hydroxy-6-metoxy-1,4-benzoquinol methylase